MVILGIVSVIVITGVAWWAASSLRKQDGGGEVSQTAIQSHRSYHIESNASGISFAPRQPVDYRFSIVDERGETKKEFATVHEKIMHVIIVRQDVQEFQHVHPTFDEKTGLFTLADLMLPSPGPYRIFADFTPLGTQLDPPGMPLGVTIFEDVTVGDLTLYTPQPLTGGPRTKTFQGYMVELRAAPTPVLSETPTTVSFDITKDGQPVTNLEPYLGALGHAVVLREGDLEFLHTHPVDEHMVNQTGTVNFAVTFPTAGTYKIFSQFQHEGDILTTDFVITVESRAAGTNEGNVLPPGAEHGLPDGPH